MMLTAKPVRALLALAVLLVALAAPATSQASEWSQRLVPGQVSERVPFSLVSSVHCYSLNGTAYWEARIPGGRGWHYAGTWRAVYHIDLRLFRNTGRRSIVCAAWQGFRA